MRDADKTTGSKLAAEAGVGSNTATACEKRFSTGTANMLTGMTQHEAGRAEALAAEFAPLLSSVWRACGQ